MLFSATSRQWHVNTLIIFAGCEKRPNSVLLTPLHPPASDFFEQQIVGDGTLSHHCFGADCLTATDPRYMFTCTHANLHAQNNFVPASFLPGVCELLYIINLQDSRGGPFAWYAMD